MYCFIVVDSLYVILFIISWLVYIACVCRSRPRLPLLPAAPSLDASEISSVVICVCVCIYIYIYVYIYIYIDIPIYIYIHTYCNNNININIALSLYHYIIMIAYVHYQIWGKQRVPFGE